MIGSLPALRAEERVREIVAEVKGCSPTVVKLEASLAETFLHIGAASVIAPAWATDLEATLEWTEAFGEAWIGKKSRNWLQ